MWIAWHRLCLHRPSHESVWRVAHLNFVFFLRSHQAHTLPTEEWGEGKANGQKNERWKKRMSTCCVHVLSHSLARSSVLKIPQSDESGARPLTDRRLECATCSCHWNFFVSISTSALLCTLLLPTALTTFIFISLMLRLPNPRQRFNFLSLLFSLFFGSSK